MVDISEKILNFLKKKDWVIVGEIVAEVNESRVTVKSELMYLFSKGLVDRQKNVVLRGSGYIWKYKSQEQKDESSI